MDSLLGTKDTVLPKGINSEVEYLAYINTLRQNIDRLEAILNIVSTTSTELGIIGSPGSTAWITQMLNLKKLHAVLDTTTEEEQIVEDSKK